MEKIYIQTDKPIVQFDNLGSYVKVKPDAFPNGKAILTFISYEKKTMKLLSNIDICIPIYGDITFNDFADFGPSASIFALQSEYHSTHFAKRYAKAKSEKRDVYTFQGGTSYDKQPSWMKRADKCAEARRLHVKIGERTDLILIAEKGKGNQLSNGLITMNGKPEERITVGISLCAWEQIVCSAYQEYNNYKSGMYARGLYDSQSVPQQHSEPKPAKDYTVTLQGNAEKCKEGLYRVLVKDHDKQNWLFIRENAIDSLSRLELWDRMLTDGSGLTLQFIASLTEKGSFVFEQLK